MRAHFRTNFTRAVLGTIGALAVSASAPHAIAEPTSGVDSALFRQSYDATGVYFLDGGESMPVYDISVKAQLGYGHAPLATAVPGIGASVGDVNVDRILASTATLDLAFAMAMHKRFTLGLNFATYRTSLADGYGSRARYSSAGPVGTSTGVIALRPLSNIDPSGGMLDDGIVGPLDLRLAGKFAIVAKNGLHVAALATVALPFGEDEMLLGDRNIVFEPKVALNKRLGPATLVANVGARIRQRSVLEAYDTQDMTASADDAKAYLDVGSEAIVGVGATYRVMPRLTLGAEVVGFVPLPAGASVGSCRLYSGARCSTLGASDYFADAKAGDLTMLANAGGQWQLNPSLAAQVLVGAGAIGARSDDFRVSTGLVWTPQPLTASTATAADVDGDGIPDAIDTCRSEAEDTDGFADGDGCPDDDNDQDGLPDGSDQCPDQAEDRDSWQDEDGCPEPDNDGDAVPDATDQCPEKAEDVDGFADDDGCPDDDNDSDGIPDSKDKCLNDAETPNGIDDTDGCPESSAVKQVEGTDRIDLNGAQLTFRGAALTPAAQKILSQVAASVKASKTVVRIEVHVALSTKSKAAAALRNASKADRDLSRRRAMAVMDYLASQGVPMSQLQAVGRGSDAPLPASTPTDEINNRVDLLKANPSN